jgi:hypothetical protein
MSWQASSWALKQRVGDPILKILLLAAANYADPDGKCWPKVETLAFDSEVSKRTIQRKLADLQALGLIRVEQQFDHKGRQIESLIFLLMEGEGDILAPRAAVGVTPACHPGGDTTLSPLESLNNHKNKQYTPASKKKSDEPYSEDFLSVWQQYPRTKNTSKKDAWNAYRMLNDENRALVKIAVPQFAAAMRAENRPDDKIKHMVRWITGRMYETAAAPEPIAPNGSTPPAQRFWEYATEKQWANVLLAWSANWQWSESWGPAPDKPGCHVPQNLLDRFDLKYRGHLFSPEEKEAKKARVSQSRDGGSVAPSTM